MPEATIQHDAHLGTGNGVTQFVCCSGTDRQFDIIWRARIGEIPRGYGANIFHTPRQAYDTLVRHLARGQEEDMTFQSTVEAAGVLVGASGDPCAGVEHMAEQLDTVNLSTSAH